MFSKQKKWEPKNKPPEATVRVVTIKSSKPRTPTPTSFHAPSKTPSSSSSSSSSAKRKRAQTSDSPVSSTSSSIHASRQQQYLAVPSDPRKRIRSPGTDTETSRSTLPSKTHQVRYVSSDSEEEPDDLFARLNRPKRPQTVREDPDRDLVSNALKALDRAGYVTAKPTVFTHASELVSLSREDDGKKNGKKVAKQADKLFPLATDEESTIELQYPGSLTRERFDLVDQKDKLDVIKDIFKVVKHVRAFYITGDEDIHSFDGPDGIIKRLKSGARSIRTNGAITPPNIAKFRQAIDDYNEIVLRRLKSGATMEVLKKQHVLPDDLVAHIMVQMYDRIITPKIDLLKAYKNGTSEVYGEMRTPFVTQVLCVNTKMTSKQTFVDLGSGVGNVVLQAALQIGCESWGCEYKDNPASLAEAQLEEFTARCELWGIQPGLVRLCHGDFTDHDIRDHAHNLKLYDILKRADVLLTNNKAFIPDLNARLGLIFLELKNGCRIVSLTDFSSASKHNLNDIAYALEQAHEHKWLENWVSWTPEMGFYYVTTRN